MHPYAIMSAIMIAAICQGVGALVSASMTAAICQGVGGIRGEHM